MLVFFADGPTNSHVGDYHSIGFKSPKKDVKENLTTNEDGISVGLEDGLITIVGRRARDTGDVDHDYLIPLD